MKTSKSDGLGNYQRPIPKHERVKMDNFQKHSALPYKHSEITKQILDGFYQVYNKLGYGFLEKVYENSLRIELSKQGLTVVQQKPIQVWYENEIVGEYFSDLVVNDLVIVELKATAALSNEHEAQLLNYLKATSYEVGLLLNFGPKPQQVRKSYENMRKEWWLAQYQPPIVH